MITLTPLFVNLSYLYLLSLYPGSIQSLYWYCLEAGYRWGDGSHCF